MNFDLRDYTSYPAEVTLTVEADNADYGVEGVAFIDVMKLKMMIQEVNDEFLCQGDVAVRVEQECSRCLNPFETELEGELNIVVITEGGKAVMSNEPGSDLVVVNPGQPVVELNEFIRQALSLSLPMKPLCSESCLGICPGCGANKNEETCNCIDENIDERWEGLRDLYD